jgi:hypothetical protein
VGSSTPTRQNKAGTPKHRGKLRQQLGVVSAFAKMAVNIDVGLITAMTVADCKISLLENNHPSSERTDE